MKPKRPLRPCHLFSCNNNNTYLLTRPRRQFTTSPLPLDPPPPPNPSPSTSQHDHKTFSFSLADHLISRGLISTAQGVVDRIVKHSPSISDFVFTISFATSRGLDFNSAYSQLLSRLCTEERYSVAFHLYNRMADYGIFPGDSCNTLLIDGLCFIGDLDKAFLVFKEMIQSGTRPTDVHLYKSLVYNFCKRRRNVEAEYFCRVMELYGLTPDRIMYTWLIYGYCKEEDMNRAVGVYERMLETGCKPDVYTYTVLISALYKENRTDEAGILFTKMLASGVAPDHVMYWSLKRYPEGHDLCLTIMLLQVRDKSRCYIDSLLITSFITSRLNKAVEEDVELWFRKILVSSMCFSYEDFSTLINALCVGGKTNLARDFLNKMRAHGFKPLLSTYNSMIKCLCHDGSFEDAKKLIGLMEEQGMLSNHATYLIMVNEHCKQGDLVSAFEVLEEMNERDLKPSVAIYDSIISALCTDERLVEAEHMFERMLKAGVVADEFVYTTLICGYSKNGSAIDACRLFEKMIKSGIKSSSYAYAALINGLIKKNMTKQGYSYLHRMLDDGFLPDNVFYSMLINQFCKKGDVSFALSLYDLMRRNKTELDLITYGSLINGVCRNVSYIARKYHPFGCKRLKKLKDMLFLSLHQITLKPINYNERGSWSPSRKMIDFAEKLMQDMKENGITPDLHVHNAMIDGYCRVGRMRDAYEQFNKMNSDGCAPNEVTYNTLIKGLCRTRRIIDALSLLHTMNKKGLYPSKVSYERLLKSLCDICLSGLAFNICEEMLPHGHVPCHCNYRLQSPCDICSSCLAFKVCEEMLFHGHVPCGRNYNRLLGIHCMLLKRGKLPDEAIKSQVVEAC
ncbi:Pentatricopeptide repeat [Macleaya cordata]|uniref:Pentatricopeptide repeat n=1 Tax=Macleaya cordata TaxID=56857 RepID=A0A200QC83_MACCD|nr:Pentatricopeptide repeat [Macleaya cordata]